MSAPGVEKKVLLIITSLGAISMIVDAIHSYGGKVFHDVTNRRHAEKAVEAGVDGLILVAAGAGGHAGTANPFRADCRGAAVLQGADHPVGRDVEWRPGRRGHRRRRGFRLHGHARLHRHHGIVGDARLLTSGKGWWATMYDFSSVRSAIVPIMRCLQ